MQDVIVIFRNKINFTETESSKVVPTAFRLDLHRFGIRSFDVSETVTDFRKQNVKIIMQS
jgi:hypothetical protein